MTVIEIAGEEDLPELLPLMRGYCDFYEIAPSDWTWSTTRAARIGVMNDLFVAPAGRGSGAAEALIGACVERCRTHGARLLAWRTAPDNHRAQAVYDRVGGRRSQWLDYDLPVDQGGAL